jgi:RNAse (barnase) inhibitor barstar
MTNIIFSNQKDIVLDNNIALVVVEAHDDTLKEFYRLLKTTLHFPDYFYENLDSLDEVLCDLSWLPQSTIQIHFKQLPQFLKKSSKREIVFELLENVQNYWKEDGSKNIILSCEQTAV